MVNRTFRTGYNRKRIRRVMQRHGLMLPWSGEVLSVAFAIDCHDREVPAYVAPPGSLTGADIRTLLDRTLWARFGEATLKAPHAIQWLSDNGPQYTATATVLYAPELGRVPITTGAHPTRTEDALTPRGGRG